MLEQKRAELLRSITHHQVDIWPEHWRAVDLFFAMGTQWVVEIAPSGKLYSHGLRYEALPIVESRLPPDDSGEFAPDPATLFSQLQTLEMYARRYRNQ